MRMRIFILSLIMLLGLLVRFDDLPLWYKHKGQTFYDNKPLLTTYDGYYYLRLARDILEDKYNSVDEYRYPPSPQPRPSPAPLISVMTAYGVKIFHIPLDWMGFILPPLLGVLIAIPVYLLGRQMGGSIAGLVAAYMTLMAPYYVYRSGMGWLDTDCLNVTFALSIALCMMKFGLCKTGHRYLFLLAGVVSAGLFLLWWHTIPAAVMVIFAVPFAVALVLDYRPSNRLDYVVMFTVVAVVVLLVIVKWTLVSSAVGGVYETVVGQITFLAQKSSGHAPPSSISTSEQVRPDFFYIAKAVGCYWWMVLPGAVGIVWLLLARIRGMLYLSALLFLSVFACLFAERFIIFMIPVVALGIGFLGQKIWEMRKRVYRFAGEMHARWSDSVKVVYWCFVVIMAVVFFYLPLNFMLLNTTAGPKVEGVQVAGMVKMAQDTPEDAVVWAWWDVGYAVQYWARRATLFDGSMHGRVSIYNAFPLATKSDKLSSDFMRYYASHAIAGADKLAEHVTGSSVDAFDFVSADGARPVYLYLDQLWLQAAHWWYWYGTWDAEKGAGIHPFYDPFYNIAVDGSVIVGEDGFRVDTNNGMLVSKKGGMQLSGVLLRFPDNVSRKQFSESGNRFEVNVPGRFGVAMGQDIAESMFNRLFVRQETWSKYFKLIHGNAPYYQIWEVLPDVASDE